MFKGVYIPSGGTPFFIGLITALVYLVVGYLFGEKRSVRSSRLLVMSLTLNVAYSLSSLVYYKWKMVQIISAFSMLKISLVTLTTLVLYLNVIYIRAEISYKRKRGNQRIQKEPKKSRINIMRENKQREENDEISITLGHSTESKEQAPPI